MSDEPTQPKKGKSVFVGLVADDDPIYQGGWKFIMGSYLAPRRTEEPQRADEAPPEPTAPDS